METIGKRLEAERKRRELTQKEFAELLSMGQSSYNEYKADKKGMSADVFMRVCEALGWTPEYLYHGKGNKMSNARTHSEAELLKLFRAIPQDQHDTVIGMIKVAMAGNLKANSGAA